MARFRMSKASEFRATIDKVIAMLAERGLKVTQVGIEAFVSYDADGMVNLVNIPQIPDSATDELIAAIRGFIDHEIGHVLETDGAAIVTAARRNPKAAGLVNIVEDVRIERAMRKRFGGTAQHLEDLWDFLCAKRILPSAKRAPTDQALFAALLPSIIHAWSGKRACQTMMDDNDFWPRVENLTKVLEPYRAALMDGSMKSTDDAIILADQMFEALKKATEAPPPPPPEEDKEDTEETKSPGEGESCEDGEPGDEPGDSDESDSSDKDDADKTADEGDGDADGDPDTDSDESVSGDDGDDADEGSEGLDDGGVGEGDEAEDALDEGDADKDDAGEGADTDADADTDGGDSAEDESVDEDDSETSGGDSADGDAGEDAGHDADEPDTSTDTSETPLDEGMINDGKDAEALIESTDFLDSMDDTEKAFTDGAKGAIAAVVKREDYIPYTTDYDKFRAVSNRDKPGVDASARMMDTQTNKLTGQLSNHFRRLFAQQEQVVKVGGLRAGRLNSPALFRLSMSDDRVFSRREEHTSTNTAVTLLIDCSGSMSGAKFELAVLSANAFSATLDRVGIAHEVLGFTTHYEVEMDNVKKARDERAMGRSFSRLDNILMPVFKEFHESYSVARLRFASVTNGMMRSSNLGLAENVDGESVEYAARRLSMRPEPRKVLIVFSDGAPAASAINSHLRSHLRETVNRLDVGGIETLGIGIMSNEVKSFYKKHAVVNKLDELPSVVMKQLEKILLR